jgi:hypothetical protein
MFTFFSISCTEHKREQLLIEKNQIIANTEERPYYIQVNDSIEDAYNFHQNRKLGYYASRINNYLEGQAIYFYNNGCLETFSTLKNGRKEGVAHYFYPSGNIKYTRNYIMDSLKGYYIEYYDKTNCIRAEYMSNPYALESFIFKRTYDSATQKVITDHDHRKELIHENPEIDPKSLQMPWEDDDWFSKISNHNVPSVHSCTQ